MSQAGEIDVVSNNPDIPTNFVTDDGNAVPIGNTLEILGTSVPAGSTPVETTGSGNTVTIEVQTSQAIAASNAANIGLAAFDSSAFSVDANGFVTLVGGPSTTSFDVQAATAPGTDPVVPSGAGVVTVNGAAVANHSVVLETHSRAANAFNLEVQYATSAAATDATKSGVAHFNSAQFTVDANGFVSSSGTGVLNTLTGNSGGAIPPTAGNINTIGTGSIIIAGAGSTLTTQLTGLTNHAVLVGAGTATITSVGPSATSGQVFQSQGAAADPAFSTATYPSTATGTGKILRADGTNWVATTATFPDTAGASGNVLTSDGTNWTSSAPSAGNNVIVTTYNLADSPATWSKNANTKYVTVYIWGGGGGGGSGRKGASGSAGGGGGAGGSSVAVFSGAASAFGNTENVVIGDGGTGGISQTADGTNGNIGNNGSNSSFGNLTALGGAAGGAGTSTTGAGGSTRTVGSQFVNSNLNNAGGTGAQVAGNPAGAPLIFIGSTGGGGGGGGDTVTERVGGAGGGMTNTAGGTILVGAAGGLESTGINGSLGTPAPTSGGVFSGGSGGGGGGGYSVGAGGATTGGTGGAGSVRGGGGGGGGGGISAVANSGAGGKGGAGQVVVVEFL